MAYVDFDDLGDVKKVHPWHFVWTFVGVLAVWFALASIFFGVNVATAGIIGRGEAHIEQQSAPNRIFQQGRFVDDGNAIVKFNQQYNDALKAIGDWDKANANKPDNAVGTLANQRQDLVLSARGIQQQCQNTIADYNNAAREYLAKDFRDHGLPDSVGIQDFCQGKPVPAYTGLAG